MCGICGIVDWQRSDLTDVVAAMCDTMLHRGPDDRGIEQLDGCCLGHQRLSIVDLSGTGHQPMTNENGGVWVVFNGEIYGFQGLVSELKEMGHDFRSSSDTEVVLHGYESWGIEGLCQRLTGMFAFALWDQKKQTLYLARDRFGEKPLYYLRQGGLVRFASNTAALFAAASYSPRLSSAGVVGYLNLSYCLPQQPILQDVVAVLPATYIQIERERIISQTYWQPAVSYLCGLDVNEWVDRLEALLRESIRKQLVADVPVGCLLSGGVDSSLIASLATELSPDLQLFTVRMPEDKTIDESSKAAQVAEKIGGRHHVLDANPVELDDFIAFQKTFSQPLGDASSIAEWLIAKYARDYVTVILTGDGGDELFVGYPRVYMNIRLEKYRRLFASPLGKKSLKYLRVLLNQYAYVPALRKALTFSRLVGGSLEEAFIDFSMIALETQQTIWGPKTLDAAQERTYQAILLDLWMNCQAVEPLDRLLQFDMKMGLAGDYLPKVDTATMACSMEARAPFLDHHLVEFSMSIPAELKFYKNIPKFLLKTLLKRRLGDAAVQSIRRKQGFVVPIDRWLDGKWAVLLDGLLHSPLLDDGILDPAGLRQVLDLGKVQPVRFSRLRYSLVVLDLWYRSMLGRLA